MYLMLYRRVLGLLIIRQEPMQALEPAQEREWAVPSILVPMGIGPGARLWIQLLRVA
jgi:hypothetical protein